MTPEEFVDLLKDTDDRCESLSLVQPLTKCVEQLQLGFALNYGLAEDEEGVAWPPHAPATVAKYGPHPLLILSGAMYDATTDTGAMGNVTEIEDRELLVGVDGELIDYAWVHQQGTERVPQRQFVYARPEALDECENLIAEFAEVELFG
jgi:hypothetical protein